MAKNQKKRNVNVYNLLIIDESGSMYKIYEQALSGINETISSVRTAQKKYPDQHHYVSVVSFEGHGPQGVKTRRDRVPISKMNYLSRKEYVPGGCTPLYDAIGLSVHHLQRYVEKDDVVFVTIITDGLENASQEYSRLTVRDLISRQREKGWTFAYIGANQDSVEVAREINIKNALNYEATPEGTNRMIDELVESMHCCYCMIDKGEKTAKDMSDLFIKVDKDGNTEIGGSLAEKLGKEILKK